MYPHHNLGHQEKKIVQVSIPIPQPVNYSVIYATSWQMYGNGHGGLK